MCKNKKQNKAKPQGRSELGITLKTQQEFLTSNGKTSILQSNVVFCLITASKLSVD